MSEETTAAPAAPIAPETVAPPTLTQKLVAEVIGTFILVGFGVGSAVAAAFSLRAAVGQSGFTSTFSTVTTVGLAFGIAIVVSVYAFGRISGGHFNPAVSVGAAIAGRISWVEAGFYIVAQIVGAIVGSLVLWIVAHGFRGFDSTEQGLGANHFGGSGGISWWGAFIIEMVLTAIFLIIILATTDTRNEHPGLAPLAIGLTLAAIHFVAIPLTGTSVNPARSIGPALFSGTHAIKQLWLFIVAPLVGGAIAGIVYPLLFGRAEDPVPGSGWSLPARTPAAAGWGPAPDQFQQQWNQQPGAESVAWGQPQGGQPQPGQPQPGQPGQPQGGQPGQLQPGQPGQPGQPQGGQPQPGQPGQDVGGQTQVSGEQSWQQPVAPTAEGELPVYEQDGWRWDYAKQQWVPIDQPPS